MIRTSPHGDAYMEMNAAEYASGEDILVTAVMHNAYNAHDYTGVMAAHATW